MQKEMVIQWNDSILSEWIVILQNELAFHLDDRRDQAMDEIVQYFLTRGLGRT